MTRDLHNRRILITGASSGIGKALAQQLASLGAKLVLAARTDEKLQAVAASLASPTGDGGEKRYLVVPTDITKDEDRQRLLDRAVEQFGGLDVVINNAGIASWAHFADSTEAILRQIMEVNFFAPAELIRKAIPILVNGVEPAIVNVAETARIQGTDLYAAEAKRITAGLEFHAKFLNGAPVPSNLCGGTLNAVTPDPMWEIARNGFATRLGMMLPQTEQVVMKIRPSGVDHHMEWETLTHAEVGSVGIH